jgi:hypothetical protein
MNKQTKMYLGIGLVAVAAYYFWNKSKNSPKANAAGRSEQSGPCRCHTSSSNGVYNCGDATHYSSSSNGYCKGRPNQSK